MYFASAYFAEQHCSVFYETLSCIGFIKKYALCVIMTIRETAYLKNRKNTLFKGVFFVSPGGCFMGCQVVSAGAAGVLFPVSGFSKISIRVFLLFSGIDCQHL